MAKFELQPLINLDELVNGAKDIIKNYADMGDKNFIMLRDVVDGNKKIEEVQFGDATQELTKDEKEFMQTVIDKLVTRGLNNDDSFKALQESKTLSKPTGGKKRSNKHSKKRSKKNRGRRTTSHRRRSRARV